MKKKMMIALGMLLQAAAACAAVQGETVEYRHGDAVLEGYIAYDDSSEEKRPGILVVHEWKGPGEYSQRRARQLAELGYIAFAVDMYGKGVRPQTHEEAAKVSGIYREDRALMRERVKAALEVLKKHPLADDSRLGAIGYCFGGTTVLELARSGEDIKGVVSFHGGLSTPTPAGKDIKAEVLVLHGANDTYISREDVEAFRKEMENSGARWTMKEYPGAVHSFTVEEAGNDVSKGAAYDPAADKASWDEMKAFFDRLFTA